MDGRKHRVVETLNEKRPDPHNLSMMRIGFFVFLVEGSLPFQGNAYIRRQRYLNKVRHKFSVRCSLTLFAFVLCHAQSQQSGLNRSLRPLVLPSDLLDRLPALISAD